jgi:hypothetical protein
VYGSSASGNGLEGSSGTGAGVYGSSLSQGVVGQATAMSGTSYGVYGRNTTLSGAGVYGESDYASGLGVHGHSAGSGEGVRGTSINGNGVAGYSTNGYGVYSQGDAHVEGSLTWQPKTSYLSVPMAAFQPSDPNYAFLNTGSMLFVCGNVADFKLFYAPVDLPQGATVTAIGFQYCSERPDEINRAELFLVKQDLYSDWEATPDPLANVTNPGTMGQVTCAVYTAPANVAIDNSQSAYHLELWLKGNSEISCPALDAGSPDVRGIFVEYTFSEPY